MEILFTMVKLRFYRKNYGTIPKTMELRFMREKHGRLPNL